MKKVEDEDGTSVAVFDGDPADVPRANSDGKQDDDA